MHILIKLQFPQVTYHSSAQLSDSEFFLIGNSIIYREWMLHVEEGYCTVRWWKVHARFYTCNTCLHILREDICNKTPMLHCDGGFAKRSFPRQLGSAHSQAFELLCSHPAFYTKTMTAKAILRFYTFASRHAKTSLQHPQLFRIQQHWVNTKT